MDILNRILQPNILPLMIPIVAIVGGVTIVIVKKVFSHRERMAMIERGINPDYPPEDEEVNQNRSNNR
jgi:hypothetical protein